MDTLPPHANNGNPHYIMLPILGRNYTLIDFIDADLADYTWSSSSRGYAARHVKGNRMQLMHRVIVERMLMRPIHKGYHVDHINGDRFDNRRANLREVTPKQNGFNRKRKTTARGSQYKGVGPKGSRWVAVIGYQRRNIHIGVYKSEIEAAKAYDAAALLLYGEFAGTNGLLNSIEDKQDEKILEILARLEKAQVRK